MGRNICPTRLIESGLDHMSLGASTPSTRGTTKGALPRARAVSGLSRGVNSMQRRDSIPTTTALGARRISGANDRIGVGLIGCGERGRGVADYLPGIGGAEIRGVADVYAPRRLQAAAQFGPTVRAFTDYRKVLESNDIDVVVIGTPDHWHAPMTIDALAAGKDAYVEKPVTHTLAEGEDLLKAVEASGRVVATGTQQRSWDHFIEAKGLIDKGELGRVTFARCHWSQNHLQSGAQGAPEVDAGQLDWDQWLGPAPKQPFDKVRFYYWRFFWDFGGGSVTDLMTHWIDVIQWFLNSTEAQETYASGTTYVHDWFDVPDTVTATLLFPEGYTATYEGNLTFGLPGCGIVFHGDKAMMAIDRHGYSVYEEGRMPFEAPGLPRPIRSVEREEPTSNVERMDGTGTAENLRNWLDCVRSRGTPNAHVRAGVEAANTAHRVNMALREKRVVGLT